MEKNFLHGTLEATIFHASSRISSNLPSNCMGCIGGEKPTYVKIKIGRTKVAETSHECSRVWNQTFTILCAHSIDTSVTITVRTRVTTLGKVRVPAHALLEEGSLASIPLLTKKGRLNTRVKLEFRLKFTRAESAPDWGRGIISGASVGLVDGVTFRERPNCSVVLYQDTHHGRDFRPPSGVGGGRSYRPRRLWEDVFNAINGAKRLIYIAAWSLNPKLVLVRDADTETPEASGVELGEILKRKADEGVAVRIMIWNDETSLPFIKNNGVMNTHDEQALEYFKHTEVVCRLVPRLHNNFPTFFAHHQKAITVDADVDLFIDDSYGRDIVSFVGGVDLCNGRYDTEDHSLFRALNTDAHAHDFYQINFADANILKGGPREPWHDAHACVIGEAGRDVLTNFEQRWAKQCDPSLLVPTDDIRTRGRNGNWNVQVVFTRCDSTHIFGGNTYMKAIVQGCSYETLAKFIDVFMNEIYAHSHKYAKLRQNLSGCVCFIPNLGQRNVVQDLLHFDIFRQGLLSLSEVLRSIDSVSAALSGDNVSFVERSIQDAYVGAIRRAQRFIYVENQYFIGGCHLWEEDQHSGCTNLIPIEIALKIASKIRARERFAAYVVMPMWPEGVPESDTVQDILHWTRLTMATMYALIANAIRESGAHGRPTDYLSFFCLANREEKGGGEYVPPESPPHKSSYWRAQNSRRFMIYVHSKLMIVDDEYIVIGSANMNQRSMDGARDTEMALGCYQPEHVGQGSGSRGDIHRYRLSLWYEHTARVDNAFVEPESLECVARMRAIGKEMWDAYAGEAVIDMGGAHLVGYPVSVSEEGIIEEGDVFPDTNAQIKGRRSMFLPPLCTN